MTPVLHMERSYYIVDAFTKERYAGNAAAVVVDAEGLADDRMQLIAREFNLSETTFVLPAETDTQGSSTEPVVRFRWFTPASEVRMCGHATIAGVHALLESRRLSTDNLGDGGTLGIETKSGRLTAFVEPLPGSVGRSMIWLELTPPVLTPRRVDRADWAAALGLSQDTFEPDLPIMETQDQDLIVFVRDAATLNAASPDAGALSDLLTAHGLRGLSLATANTVTPSVGVQSRFFCPQLGVPEDPVTGSVHGPLAAYLMQHDLIAVHDGTAGFMAVQGRPGGRTGVISVLARTNSDQRISVRIGGEAVTAMRGVLLG